MQAVCLSERFDRLIRSVPKRMYPGVSATDRPDQTLVVRTFRRRIGFHFGRWIPCFGRPRNSDFLGGAISIGGTSRGYQELTAGNYDALERSNGGGRTVGGHLLLMCFEGGKDRALDFRRRDASDRPCSCFSAPQQC